MKLTKTIISSSSLALLLVLSAPVARAALGISFTTTADVTTAIPGGTGTFTNFPTAPAVSNGAVSFLGYGVNGQQGCYILLPPNPIMPLADLNTAVPNGTGNFTDFDLTDLSLSGTSLAFIGAGSGSQLGVYVAAPTDPYRVIADLNTTIPGGSGFFTNFLPPNPILPTAASISGSNVAFIGYGDLSQIGVYAKYGTDLPSVVADLNTPIPGGTGNFTGFLPPNPIVPPNPVISGDVIAFLGFGSAGQQGYTVSCRRIPSCRMARSPASRTQLPRSPGAPFQARRSATSITFRWKTRTSLLSAARWASALPMAVSLINKACTRTSGVAGNPWLI